MVPVEGGAWDYTRVGLGTTHTDLGCLLSRSCRVEECVVYICLTVVSRMGFGRYLSALRVMVIILTDEIGRSGWRGGGLCGLGRR